MNTYGYVGGNPLGFVDPLGLVSTFLQMSDPAAAFEQQALALGNDPSTREGASATATHVSEEALFELGVISSVPITPTVGAGILSSILKVSPKFCKVKNKSDVLLDSSVVPDLRKNPTLGGRIKPGENPVVSNVTRPELRNAVSTGNLKGVPRALNDLPVVNPATSVNTRINIRGQLPAHRGRFGDGVIGAQAVEGRMPLITNDAALGTAVRAAGGVVR